MKTTDVRKSEWLMFVRKYLGVSKSSDSDSLLLHSMIDKTFFLYRMIEKKILFLSMLFDRTSIDIITIKS